MIIGIIIVCAFVIGSAAMFVVSEFYRRRIEDALKWRAYDACRHARKALPCVEVEEDPNGDYVPRKERRLFNAFDEDDYDRIRSGERVTKMYRGGERDA